MKLKEIRTQKGMSQATVAKGVGVTNQAICNYEKGIREPGIPTLKKLASVLECTVDELIEDEETDEQGRV